MKHLLRLALSVALLASLSGAAGARQGVDVRHSAFAMFELKAKRGAVGIVGIHIEELRSASGTKASYMVFRGYCFDGATDPLAECMVSDRGYKSGSLKPDEYDIDPLLRTASVKLSRKGTTHEVTWTSSVPSQPAAFETYCESGDPSAAAGGGFNALADGTLFGKKGQTSLAGIDVYAFASACPGE